MAAETPEAQEWWSSLGSGGCPEFQSAIVWLWQQLCEATGAIGLNERFNEVMNVIDNCKAILRGEIAECKSDLEATITALEERVQELEDA